MMQQQMQQQNQWISILLKAQTNQQNPHQSQPSNATPLANTTDTTQAQTAQQTALDLDAAAFAPPTHLLPV